SWCGNSHARCANDPHREGGGGPRVAPTGGRMAGRREHRLRRPFRRDRGGSRACAIAPLLATLLVLGTAPGAGAQGLAGAGVTRAVGGGVTAAASGAQEAAASTVQQATAPVANAVERTVASTQAAAPTTTAVQQSAA